MKEMLRTVFAVTLAVSLVTLPIPTAWAGTAPAADPAKTLANLQAAFNGESNAHARYLAFAEKATEEGYGAVASLFSAAASAEEVHAANHAEVIKEMGGAPRAEVGKPEVKSTRENLMAAIAGESYERDTMYPEFLAQARADRNRDALQTFNYAMSAEAQHADFYQGALDGLEGLAGSGSRTYYVCTVCGATVTGVDFAKCPACFSPKEKYAQIS